MSAKYAPLFKVIQNVSLTFFFLFSLPASAVSNSCVELFIAPQFQSSVEQHNQLITKGRFNQGRSFFSIAKDDIPGLSQALTELPAGSVVLDLGSGRGGAIGSIFRPELFQITERMYGESKEGWAKSAQQVSHLHFLGVTATPAAEQLVPLEDSLNRYTIIAGKFFENIEVSDLINIYSKKISAAYDAWGVFSYSSRPDIDLATLQNIMAPGSATYIVWKEDLYSMAEFQFEDGNFGTIVDYVEKYFSDSFKITFKKNGRHGLITLIRTEGQATQPTPVKMLYSKTNELPWKRFFRVEVPLSQVQAKINEELFWDHVRPDYELNSINNGTFTVEDPATHKRREATVQENYEHVISVADRVYGSFSIDFIQRKDPFWRHKILSAVISTGNFDAAKKYYEAHEHELQTGFEIDLLFRGLLDLAIARTDSATLENLKNHLSDPKIQLWELAKHARDLESPFPFTVESALATLRDGGLSNFILMSPTPNLSKQWSYDSNLYRKDNPVEVATDAQTASAHSAIVVLLRAWKKVPGAVSWANQ